MLLQNKYINSTENFLKIDKNLHLCEPELNKIITDAGRMEVRISSLLFALLP